MIPTPPEGKENTATEAGHKFRRADSGGRRTPWERALHLIRADEAYQREIMLGRRLGFYKIHKEIGAGNFSKVKLATHILTKERVAVKALNKTKLDHKGVTTIMREVENMRMCHHPNIIAIFEIMDSMSKLYMVMELAGGGDLYSRVVDNGALTEPHAKQLFVQILGALEHMHSKNIFHRDIKAENVFFSSEFVVKLGDLGFSIQTDSKQSQLHTFCGSPPYAAPELFTDSFYMGHLSDVWALGILLYFMSTGTTPFRGDTIPEMKASILEAEVPIPVSQSREWAELVRAILQRVPAKRISLADIGLHDWVRPFTTAPPHPPPAAIPLLPTVQNFGVTDEMVSSWGWTDLNSPLAGVCRIAMFRQFNAAGPASLSPLPNAPAAPPQPPKLPFKSQICTIL